MALALAVAGALADAARADDTLNARARDVLATHCPSCREAHDSGAGIDLAKIARDPTLVWPGNPDGSPAYTSLLRRLGGSRPSPSPEELSVLRAWIEGLPPEVATCPSATFVPRERIEAELARVAAQVRKPLSALRILSLAHLDLGCATPEQLAAWRQMLELVLAAVADIQHPVPTHVLDPQGHNLAFDIQDLGWDAYRWRVILGMKSQFRRTEGPLLIRADQFVAQVLRGEFGTARAGPDGPVPSHLADDHHMREADRQIARNILGAVAPPDKIERNAELMLQLAREHLAPLNLPRVAAEIGMQAETLASALEPAASGDRPLLRRLIYSAVRRSDIEGSWSLIGRLARVVPPERAIPLVPIDADHPTVTSASPIELTLYPNLPRYTVGDEIKLSIRANVDCHLTVISINAAGLGTVIFPNDFVTNNRIAAHLSVSLPAQNARYRFRLGDKGRERIVAICTRNEGRVDGIRHDFERQRFQELGPYSDFLNAALERAVAPETDRAEREKSAIVPQSEIWRTGIVMDVQ